MSANKSLLDYYGNINAGYLHAYGKAGTEKLLQLINFKKGDSILEIGFGTGTTLVNIASKNKDVKLYGIEQSQIMFEKATQRIRYSGLGNRISLQQIEPGQTFPFANYFFDKVIIESVLSIQDDSSLHFMLSEISRVLKPFGMLCLNETVWLSSITKEEIEKVNSYCKSKFGIIQASGTYKYREEWKEFLRANKFKVLELKSIKDIELRNEREKLSLNEFLSKIFSAYGKIRGKLISGLRRESLFYKQAMKNIFENKQYLEGIIIIASKTISDE